MPSTIDHTSCPYKGLQPYTEADSNYFFGRTRDVSIIISNLYAAWVTVFYGASGVGKSSVLLAGAVPRLRKEPRDAVVVVFNSWQGEDFLGALKNEVAKQAGLPAPIDIALPLDEFLKQTQSALGLPLFLIFDQFEEYFLYHPPSPSGDVFESAFARAVNRRIQVNFFLSLREDGLSKLDRLKARVPSLLNNMLRLRHLDRDAANEAITKPLDEYNRRLPNGQDAVTIEPGLVEAVLNDLRGVRVVSEHSAQGKLADLLASSPAVEIETPLLQMVMTRLWDEELGAGSRVLRLQTFEALGRAANIARTHLDTIMDRLTEAERNDAANMLRFMVTPSGAKIAQEVGALASWAELTEAQVQTALTRLSGPDMRILRTVQAPGEQTRYEIFHDVLAQAILAWRRRYVQEQKELDAERTLAAERARGAEELERAKHHARRWRWGVLGLSSVLLIIVALGIIAFLAVRKTAVAEEKTRTVKENSSRKLAEFATDQLQHDPQQSVKLAVGALIVAETAEAEEALRNALRQSHVRLVVDKLGPVRDIAFSPDGKYLVVALWDQGARVLEVATGDNVSTLIPGKPKTEVRRVAFSTDGKYVIASVGNQASVWEAWTTSAPREVATLVHSNDVWGVGFSPRDKYIVTGDGAGSAYVWKFERGMGRSTGFYEQLPGGGGIVFTAVFGPDEETVLLANRDKQVKVWTLSNATGPGNSLDVGKGRHEKQVNSAAFSHDGNYVVTTSDDTRARVWEWRKEDGRRSPIATLHKSVKPIRNAVFSPDDKFIATVNDDGVVSLWEWRTWQNGATGRDPIELRGHTNSVFCVAFDARGDFLATGSEDKTLRVWKALVDPSEAQGSVIDLLERARKQMPPNPGK